MKTSTSIVVVALAVCVVALAGYSAHTTVRIHRLEQRLNSTDQRLQQVEAALQPHVELLGANNQDR